MNFENVAMRKSKNEKIVSVVQEMLRAEVRRILPSSIVQRVKFEYLMGCGKPSGESLNLILQTYNLMRNREQAIETLSTSFYDNDPIKNYGIKVLLEKIDVCAQKERVLLKFHAIGDSQLCDECYAKFIATNKIFKNNYVMSECDIEPQHSYWFTCNYICDYCFKNKLYTKM
jgi:hypothetical protein